MAATDAYRSALRLLTRREHATKELADKLASRGFEPADIDAALVLLTEENYLNEARFAECFVRYRASQGKGPVLIREQLSALQVSADDVDAAFDRYEGDWLTNAADVILKKFGSNDVMLEFKVRMKQKAFLQRRGFSMSHISEVCSD